MDGSRQPAGNTPLHSCNNPTIWGYREQDRTCAPGLRLILPKRPEVTLVDNRPTKIVNTAKGSLFNTPPVEIISIIDG